MQTAKQRLLFHKKKIPWKELMKGERGDVFSSENTPWRSTTPRPRDDFVVTLAQAQLLSLWHSCSDVSAGGKQRGAESAWYQAAQR